MPKASNIVRFKVKQEHQGEFENFIENCDRYEGEFLRTVVKTSEDTYCAFGIWDDEESMVAARPEMIAFLDTIRHLLSEISPELGVTDPVSGEVLFLDGIDWRSGTLHEYATELPHPEKFSKTDVISHKLTANRFLLLGLHTVIRMNKGDLFYEWSPET